MSASCFRCNKTALDCFQVRFSPKKKLHVSYSVTVIRKTFMTVNANTCGKMEETFVP